MIDLAGGVPRSSKLERESVEMQVRPLPLPTLLSVELIAFRHAHAQRQSAKQHNTQNHNPSHVAAGRPVSIAALHYNNIELSYQQKNYDY